MSRASTRLFVAFVLAAALPAQQRAVVTTVGITVRDLDRSIRFYTDVLRFAVVERRDAHGAAEERLRGVFGTHTETAVLQLGEERVELVEFLAPRGRSVPEDSRSNDLWFQHIAIVVRDMDVAYERLREHRVQYASPVPQTLPASNPDAGGIRAFYFQDPDGHPLEVLQFPPGKGDPRWHMPTEELFLGIDHTAIVVADTAASLAFWRDRVGLTVAGHADNQGEEQERLNNVRGAHLRITTLRGAEGPGVELLEYLTPRTGRAMPADTAANDLWHWFVTVVPATVAARGLAVDPDGHRVLFASSTVR
ncbi:MAG: VOC family protein [Planctomycetes bacterium]|nr:VOC family protein [Planctomycetota bacterium]